MAAGCSRPTSTSLATSWSPTTSGYAGAVAKRGSDEIGWLAMYDRLVWIDCEMTGLDLGADALIEVAALVTDGELNVLGEGIDLVVKPPQQALDQMGELVQEMHTASGLLAELSAGVSLAEAEEQVLSYVRSFAPEAGKAPLAGNTVATDRAFLARDM